MADAGWLVLSRAGDHRVLAGEHGYDPASPLMDALFVAHGPAFRRGYVQPAFDNVDVYPLMAQVLGIDAAAERRPSGGRSGDAGPAPARARRARQALTLR